MNSPRPEKNKINLSSTFMARARCPICTGRPHFYYVMNKSIGRKNAYVGIEITSWINNYIKRMSEDFYLSSSPKYYRKVLDAFSFRLSLKSYAPIQYRARGLLKSNEDAVTEFLSCACGQTIWAFNVKSTKHRPEITNRKGKYSYPGTFDW